MRSIILYVDVGSSRICCSAYEYRHNLVSLEQWSLASCMLEAGDKGVMCVGGNSSSDQLVDRVIQHTIPLLAISDAGNVRINEVLLGIDNCIDEMLKLLSQQHHHAPAGDSSYQVIAIGFTTFVMNLVAVDIHGDPVGEAATCSYACNKEDVVEECHRLRDLLGPEKLHALHQRTGAPLNASYALPQLRAFYRNVKYKSLAKQIEKWQTISSICLHRWSGRPNIQMPVSFSEASWTGMLDFHTGCWDDEAINLVETCEGVVQYTHEDNGEGFIDDIDLFPPTADFDAPLPNLRGGIPKFNYDGSVNSYWERWPELRSYPVNLFLGVGGVTGTRPSSESEWVRLHYSILPSNNFSDSGITVPPGLLCKRVHRDQIIVGDVQSDVGGAVEWAQSRINVLNVEALVSYLPPVYEN